MEPKPEATERECKEAADRARRAQSEADWYERFSTKAKKERNADADQKTEPDPQAPPHA